jgi:hypothetical protein
LHTATVKVSKVKRRFRRGRGTLAAGSDGKRGADEGAAGRGEKVLSIRTWKTTWTGSPTMVESVFTTTPWSRFDSHSTAKSEGKPTVNVLPFLSIPTVSFSQVS